MFFAPAFLAGLLAIGLPIWLHRVARANPTRLPFPSLMLLEASELQRTAHRTLRYWLLLALRIAMLIALVFAFAGPLVPPRAIPVINPNARLHAIVLDRSMSMQYQQRWQRALDEAQKVIDSARSGDQLLLVAGAGRRIEVMHELAGKADADAVSAALRSIEPGIERLDYGLLMTASASWLGTPQLPVQLHLVSDLQRTASPLRFADLEPPPDTQLVLHDVGSADAANTYIKDATFVSADTRTLSVEVGTTSTQRTARDAVVSVDGKDIERKHFEFTASAAPSPSAEAEGAPLPSPVLPAAGAADVRSLKILFPSLNIASGTHRIEVRLEPQDALPQDDRFYAVVQHADPHVLLLARNGDADDTSYFAAAIGSLAAPRLVVEQRNSQAVESRSLANYSVAVVTDVAALSSAATSRITDYVQAGGSLLVTLGPGAAGQHGDLLRGLRIGDVKAQPTRVGRIDSTHPVLRDADGWQEIRFLRHLQVEPAAGDKVLIALQDGAPLLIERSLGAGRVLILATALDREWNDLATHPLFVRFIAESARYLTGAAASAASTRVGTAVMTGLTATSGGQIFDPQGRRALQLNQVTAAERLVPDQAGFYEVRQGDNVRWIAVNVDARESDLTRLSAGNLQRWQGLRSRQALIGEQPIAARAQAAPTVVPRSLGYTLLLIAATLLLIEIFMANYYLTVRREVPR